MKTLIAIPAMDSVKTEFCGSLVAMQKPKDSEILIMQGSLVHAARNQAVWKAIKEGFDAIMWIDSDMTFRPDAAERLVADAERGYAYISALCFSRKLPTAPVIYRGIQWTETDSDAFSYHEYPKNSIFEIAASGAAFCIVKTDLYKAVMDAFHTGPYEPLPRFGEDLSFCWRLKECGIRMYCDSSVRIGHVGTLVYDESVWENQQS